MSTFYYMNPKAPTPSRIHLGAVVAIFHGGLVLLDHRRDGSWGLIGGAMEVGESMEECARREVLEETGLAVGELRLLGLFSHASRIIEYANGEAVQSVTACFAAEATSDALRLSSESRAVRFCSRADVESVDIVATHRMIVPHLFAPATWPVIK